MQQQVKTSTRMQFINKDETALLQIDSDLLTVNKLKPYSTWQEFSKMSQR